MSDEKRLLPTDPFDVTIERLTGLPDGAHTQPVVVPTKDFYGNTTNYIVQTFRWAEGDTVFVTQVNADGGKRFMLPPKVVNAITRQREAVSLTVRRRIGKRTAAARKAAGLAPAFMKNPGAGRRTRKRKGSK